MIKIIHIITGLGSGGAENMLYKLIKYSDKEKYYHEVISLMDEGTVGQKIKDEGVKVHSLELSSYNVFQSIMKVRRICKSFDLVNTWLYHADVLGFLVSKIFLRKKLIWNIRHSNLDKSANKRTTFLLIRINSYLSTLVDKITYNSKKAYENHNKIGYSGKEQIIIPNGFEVDKFKFEKAYRKKIRSELSLTDDDKIIITVGRWDIQKDYPTLIKALKLTKEKNNEFKMIMVGTNLSGRNKDLVELIDSNDLQENILLLGRQDNIPELLSAADIYVSSSLGESFSNSIGEAMACGLRCIVTDVGDSKDIVGNEGRIVGAGDFHALSKEILAEINNDNLDRNYNARQKVINDYGIFQITKRFEENFTDLFLKKNNGV
ncbi:MAG: glycosyltransferase [Firmicutes bacterium]|nr:glycosyltransferase [Bacillota bacterium]